MSIAFAEVRNIHKNQVQTGDNNDHNKDKIIQLLGGINKIMMDLGDLEVVNKNQKEKIDVLLNSPDKYTNDTIKNLRKYKPNTNFIYYFSTDNTFLHKLF
eukprot:532655_1